MDQGRQVHSELDQAFLSQIRSQPGEVVVVHSSLQPGQLHEEAGVARVGEALVADQSSNQDDQDRGTASATCPSAGVSTG
jgi:hypothetical protein